MRLWTFGTIIRLKVELQTNPSVFPFLTNLEDEISVKGVGFVTPQKSHFESGRILQSFFRIFLKSYPLK